MGYGQYSQEAHEDLVRGRTNVSREQVFKQRSGHPLMDPRGVRARESRDSAEHPHSVPIAFALDVTGSMGAIPEQIARHELPGFMKLLADCGVQDPQVLFLAIGDATCDKAPLQVGQFETTAELMDQWLIYSYLEGGGGGNAHESYELAMYFLAEHTDMDSWVKRKRRGYMFMTGNELPFPAVSKHQVDTVIGDRLDDDIPTEDVVAALSETYHPFFLIPSAEYARSCERTWRDLLGDHVIVMSSPSDTCYVAAGAIALTEGRAADIDQLAQLLTSGGAEPSRVRSVINALTPYAATLGRDGAPALGRSVRPSVTGAKSLWKRLTSNAK
jgi:hypothetical protein